MNAVKVILVTVLAAAISIGAAIYGERWIGEGKVAVLEPQQVGDAQADTLPDFRLPDLDGREISSAEWAGKVLVINYWASWCPTCIHEMPTLIRTQQAHDVAQFQVVGIAIDQPDAVEHFLVDHPVNYPILIGNPEAVEISRRLGNRMQGIPFTVIFDRHGRRVFSQVGEVSPETLKARLAPLLPGATSPESVANSR